MEKTEEKERIQLFIDADVARKFREILAERGGKKGDISKEITTLLRENLSRLKTKAPIFVQKDAEPVDEATQAQIELFYESIETYEREIGRGLIILKDEKSGALYTECHIRAKELINNRDLNAQVNPNPDEEEESFKMNRDVQKTHPAFKRMISDSKNGRQFSDLVIEFNNSSYRPTKPLKILGGQHRILAIEASLEEKNRVHGIRVYFNLSTTQRIEIADVANTNINISLDLRDRMYEEGLVPAGKLIEWCVHIGILSVGENFAEKRLKIQNRPTVRMMRAFIVNFYEGKAYKKSIEKSAPVPGLPDSGGMDDKYVEIYERIKGDFTQQKDLTEAAVHFVKLYNKQIRSASEEYKYRALNLAVISSWAFVAGFLSQSQKNKPALDKLYKMPTLCGNNDPLNSSAMDKARDDSDPQNYRMGARFGSKERGRLTQLFYRYATSEKLMMLNSKAFNEAIRHYNILKGQEELSNLESAF